MSEQQSLPESSKDNRELIDLPGWVDDQISLAEKIIARHIEKGPGSPIKTGQIADLNYKIKEAKIKHAEGLKYKKLMDDALRERDRLLGLDRDNSGGLVQTLKQLITMLNEIYSQTPELEEWGLKKNSI